ncbi:sigma-70 family RNA polymerase sigma factor [Micromonospora lupini]|uniref:sigma-70 family RNA polymerase sigma factor n=1 Tax=Micromonospora lupini TaxID=285679 RepID=UPI0033F78DD2
MQRLYAEHAGPLYRFLVRLSWGEADLAEDLLQDTLLQVWRRLDHLPTGSESVRRFLFTVARRVAIDAARARRARPTEVWVEDMTWLGEREEVTEAVVASCVVRRALPKLTNAHRDVLVELYYLEHSVEEAAVRLGIPNGTVKSRAHYALRALRAAIGPTEEG